jgi:hypothetical protein
MDPVEAQARAIIAAALIVRGAVEIPAMPSGSQRGPDAAGVRLRDLTDYVYRLLTIDKVARGEVKGRVGAGARDRRRWDILATPAFLSPRPSRPSPHQKLFA